MSANEQNFAFPRPSFGPNEPAYGLTKREYFAAFAMQGILSNSNFDYSPLTDKSLANAVSDAFLIADAMIEESEKSHAR